MTNKEIIGEAIRKIKPRQIKKIAAGELCDSFGNPIPWQSIRMMIVKHGQAWGTRYKTKLNKEKTILAIVRIK